MSIFPTELVLRILYYTDPQDIIQWRTVSKWFHDITCDPALWKALYKSAPFPRPPGPFPTQSNTSLERTLVKATQLAQSWTTRPMRVVSTVAITKGIVSRRVISGRWVVTCESTRRFVLHDVDPTAGTHTRQVLWELEEPVVREWDAKSVVSAEGHCFIYVLLTLSDNVSLHWKVLEFRLNYDTGELEDSAAIDPPHWQAGSHLGDTQLYAENSRLLFIRVEPLGLVLDTRTRVFYKFPLLTMEMDARVFINWMVFADPHIICFHSDGEVDSGIAPTQVFTLPPDGAPGENGQPVLCLTHEGDVDNAVMKAMKPSIDPVTGATNIRFLCSWTYLDDLDVICIDLTLPKRSAVESQVLPITSKMHIISLPTERVRISRYISFCQHADISDDGHIRGFFFGRIRRKKKPRPWDPNESQHIMKFAVDMTQDPWAITCGRMVPDEDLLLDKIGWVYDFDGIRGRLCCDLKRGVNEMSVVDLL